MDECKVILTLLFSFSFLGILISAYFFFIQQIRMGTLLGGMFLINSAATFAYAMEISTISAGGTFQWVIVRYLTAASFVVVNLLFVLNYSQTPIKYRTWQFFSLILFPGIALLYFSVNPNSPMIYDQIGTLSFQEIVTIDWMLPPLYVLFQTYMSALFAFQYFILFRNFREQTKLDQINTVIIASGISVLLATHLLQLVGWRFLGSYNLTYFAFFPSALLTLWGYQRFRLGNIRPLAYHSVFNQMREGILVLNHNGHLVDYNPAAEDILHLSSRLSLGQTFDPVRLNLSDFPDYKNQSREADLRYEVNGTPFQIINCELFDRGGMLNGYLITLRDISCQLEAENIRVGEMERKAVWKERRNVARTLHDSIMQDMNSLIILSNAARERHRQGKTDQLPPVLDLIIKSARYASMEVINLTRELQVGGDADTGFSLAQSLAERVEFVKSQSGARISLELPGELHLPNYAQREFFYIILEALNNAIKHADANQISIILSEVDGSVSVEVMDDGVGFSSAETVSSGMGILNMRQRASQIGADFSLDSTPGEGARVRVTLDVQEG